jgi:hypothetical protein
MKKTLSVLSLTLLSGLAFCQLPSWKVLPAQRATIPTFKNHTPQAQKAQEKQLITNVSTQAAFFTDDFSVPANWTINTPVGSGTAKDWQIGTAGPAGSFAIPKINSTTQANGFALFDSDKNCSSNQIADITTANPINCSTHPNIFLNFEEQYRRFYDSTFVYISNNNTTWTKYEVNKPLNNNDFCATNPTNIKINITPTAGGQATVWVRFEFYSPSSLGSSAGCGYSWMIDDVSLTDMPTNDVSLDHVWADMYYTYGGYYTQIPQYQVMPIAFRGAISNQGVAAQTNDILNVTVNDGVSNIYNQSSPAFASLPYQAFDTLMIATPTFNPAVAIKNYTVRYHVTDNQAELPADTLNNTVVKQFSTTDTVFARDNGIKSGITSTVNYTGGDADTSKLGNLFEIRENSQAASISVWIDSASSLGTSYCYQLYMLDTVAAVWNLIAHTPMRTINAAPANDLNQWVTMLISAPLQAHGSYIAAIGTIGEVAATSTTAAIGVYVGSDNVTQQPPKTSFVFPQGATTPGWFYINELPMIRLNVVHGPAGIQEHTGKNLMIASASPNPASNTVTLTYSVSQESDVVIDIYDLGGRKIESFQEKGVNGTRTPVIDLSKYASGTYIYSITGNNSQVHGKFVVSK